MNNSRPVVLLVEDDPDTAALYQAMLASEDLEVVRCTDRRAARSWWEDSGRKPDLLVVDVRLPDGTGLDLCREITGDGPCPPILVLSAHGGPRMPSLCQAAGAQAFLDKLRDLDRLVDTVQHLLGYNRTSTP